MKPSKCGLLIVFFAAGSLAAQTQTPSKQTPPAKAAPADEPKKVVFEEIIARVNNQIITRGDLAKARADMASELHDDCQNCTPQQIDQQIADREKDLLRDLIDQSLLVQRAKDDDINVETDLIKQLDEIRQQNNLPDMDALAKKITESGLDYEDFKSSLRNKLLTNEVIRKEVSSQINIAHEEVVKYYNEHKQEFVRPEAVALREIFISTEKKAPEDIPALKKKAEDLRDRVLKNGDDFGELAKHYSDSSTAKQNGELGTFERSKLDPAIADVAFKLDRGQMTDVIQTKTGFEVLQVEQRYDAGIQPLDKVEGEITYKLSNERIEPLMRNYLKTLREDSYVKVMPGYVDTASVGNSLIEQVAPVAEKDDSGKKPGHKFLFFGHKKSSGS